MKRLIMVSVWIAGLFCITCSTKGNSGRVFYINSCDAQSENTRIYQCRTDRSNRIPAAQPVERQGGGHKVLAVQRCFDLIAEKGIFTFSHFFVYWVNQR